MRKLILLLTLLFPVVMNAADYVVISGTVKLYEQPSSTGYAAQSASGADVVAERGMVFRCDDVQGAWDKVEYVTGMRAFVSGDMVVPQTSVSIPTLGSYTVNNTGGNVTIARAGDAYTLNDGKTTYNGTLAGNALIFKDITGEIDYSAVTVDNQTYIYNYSQYGW